LKSDIPNPAGKCQYDSRRLDARFAVGLGIQQNGRMKTTVDLPDALLKQVKLRALRDGRKLKDEVADLLRKGLAAAKKPEPIALATVVSKDRKSRLPVIECKSSTSPAEEVTPAHVANILLAQEVTWQHEAGR
jgi:plasmid stability protein